MFSHTKYWSTSLQYSCLKTTSLVHLFGVLISDTGMLNKILSTGNWWIRFVKSQNANQFSIPSPLPNKLGEIILIMKKLYFEFSVEVLKSPEPKKGVLTKCLSVCICVCVDG